MFENCKVLNRARDPLQWEGHSWARQETSVFPLTLLIMDVPYMTIPVVIVTNRSVAGPLTLDDQAGKRVAVVSKYVTDEYFRN